MENSDKQLRDKLNSNEFAFDPHAWGQMEAMLDGKKKRRGFFWWWTGGIAAALLCMFAGYQTHELVGNKQLAITQVQSTQSEVPAHGRNAEQRKIENIPANNTAILTNGQTQAQEKTTQPVQESAAPDKLHTSKTAKVSQTEVIKHKKSNTVSVYNAGTANGGQFENQKNRAQKKSKKSGFAVNTGTVAAGGALKKSNSRSNPNKGNTSSTTIAKFNEAQQEVIALNSAAVGGSLSQEQVIINKMGVALLQIPTENTVTATDKASTEDLLPKSKKKIFNYSLGALASVTGTTLGRQTAGTDAESQTGFFYNQPSYMAGFTHDFLFVNRVAITNSILYGQTTFKVSAPKTVSYSKAPTSYTSTVKELAIPIGIKVYPVVKPGFKFYINTGIINHIKLKETFSYTLVPDTPSSLANIGQNDPYSLPNQTEFGTQTKTADVLGAGGGTETTTKDFSINNAKRYYTSFYASAGFEFIVKKNWIFFTEPQFYMSLQKIGVQDKRKYNLGAIGGVRYQF